MNITFIFTIINHRLISAYFLWEFLSSFLTLVERECNLWNIVLKSWSWNSSSRIPSRIAMPIRLLSTGCWKIKFIDMKMIFQTYRQLVRNSFLTHIGLIMYLTCNISKSIRRPDLVVSDPIRRLKSSEKLENNAALAATRVRIFVFSSLGSRSAAGYPLN